MKFDDKSQFEYYNSLSELTPKLNSNTTFDAKYTGVAFSSSYFIQ